MEVSLLLARSVTAVATGTQYTDWTLVLDQVSVSSSQTMNSTFVPFELRWKVTKYHISISHLQLFRLYILPTCALFNDIKVEYSVGDLTILDSGQF